MSDYVPGLDDGLALDYGPVPDSDAARDYTKALDYDAPPRPAEAHGPAEAPGRAEVPGTAEAPGPPEDPGLREIPGPPEVPGGAEAPGPGPAPAPGPGPAPAPGPALAPGPAPGPGVATALAKAPDPAPGTAAEHAAPSGEDWPPDQMASWVTPAMYWRRRTVALAVGIAVLTFLAWAVSGVLHGSRAAQPAGHGARPSAHQHARQPPATQHNGRGTSRGGYAARASGPQALAGATAGRAHTTRAGHSTLGTLTGITDMLAGPGTRQRDASAAPQAPRQAAVHAQAHHPPARRVLAPHIPACGRGDVVLSLVSPGSWYQRGRWPLFGVEAVSTGTRPCRFNMGSRFATVVVSSGRARIWGSADCVPGAGSRSVVLSRGAPAVRWIYWDRATSVPGCRRPGRAVRQGAYTAIAFDGQLTSRVMVFLLGRPGSYLP